MGRPYEEVVGVGAGVQEEVQEVPLSGEEPPEESPVVAAAGSDRSPSPQPPPFTLVLGVPPTDLVHTGRHCVDRHKT